MRLANEEQEQKIMHKQVSLVAAILLGGVHLCRPRICDTMKPLKPTRGSLLKKADAPILN